jgi:large subunit ribosomal protein L3
MNIGLVGQKCGMTRIFTENGDSIPVTVIKVEPNRITQIKNLETDGYCAVQVTVGSRRASRVNKAMVGHYAKSGAAAGVDLWEFTLSSDEIKDLTLNHEFKVDIFKDGQIVDVSGITKGKGFAGVIKRHHFAAQDATHGNSLSHRAPGSIGQRQTPGRVFKGKRMAGHLGNVKRTVPNQKIVRVDAERNLLLVRGGVPGAPMGYVVINLSTKKRGKE